MSAYDYEEDSDNYEYDKNYDDDERDSDDDEDDKSMLKIVSDDEDETLEEQSIDDRKIEKKSPQEILKLIFASHGQNLVGGSDFDSVNVSSLVDNLSCGQDIKNLKNAQTVMNQFLTDSVKILDLSLQIKNLSLERTKLFPWDKKQLFGVRKWLNQVKILSNSSKIELQFAPKLFLTMRKTGNYDIQFKIVNENYYPSLSSSARENDESRKEDEFFISYQPRDIVNIFLYWYQYIFSSTSSTSSPSASSSSDRGEVPPFNLWMKYVVKLLCIFYQDNYPFRNQLDALTSGNFLQESQLLKKVESKNKEKETLSSTQVEGQFEIDKHNINTIFIPRRRLHQAYNILLHPDTPTSLRLGQTEIDALVNEQKNNRVVDNRAVAMKIYWPGGLVCEPETMNKVNNVVLKEIIKQTFYDPTFRKPQLSFQLSPEILATGKMRYFCQNREKRYYFWTFSVPIVSEVYSVHDAVFTIELRVDNKLSNFAQFTIMNGSGYGELKSYHEDDEVKKRRKTTLYKETMFIKTKGKKKLKKKRIIIDNLARFHSIVNTGDDDDDDDASVAIVQNIFLNQFDPEQVVAFCKWFLLTTAELCKIFSDCGKLDLCDENAGDKVGKGGKKRKIDKNKNKKNKTSRENPSLQKPYLLKHTTIGRQLKRCLAIEHLLSKIFPTDLKNIILKYYKSLGDDQPPQIKNFYKFATC